VQLLCPAGSFPAVKCALDNGADAVYIGFKNDTNARHFAGLNFQDNDVERAAELVHLKGKLLHIAINTFAQAGRTQSWFDAVDRAVELGADALILADIAVLDYAANHYPHVERHLSVQSSATNLASINFYHQYFKVSRVVLPRVLSLQEVETLAAESPVPLEVFAFGSLCIMAEGRCYLSSYLTGESPNTVGACSPAAFVEWKKTPQALESRLNGFLIDRFGDAENVGYPTLCKGRFSVEDKLCHAMEEPTSLNTLNLIPQLSQAGIAAVKIEGRQRSPAYVKKVTQIWRAALDHYAKAPQHYTVNPNWQNVLGQLSEGAQTTLGPYNRSWK